MKILVVKYSRNVAESLEKLKEGDYVVAICDPDLNGRMLAKHDMPVLDVYSDPSKAIRESNCDAVLLTISDHASQLAMLAMAYKKAVWMLPDVNVAARVFEVAVKTSMGVGWL